tara:strand:+ start:11553 stop:11927 length:375 start_codon:yes stop_codon:yes gene_type:complete
MNTETQLTIWEEPTAILSSYDHTMEKTNRPGLKLWSRALRAWVSDLIHHRDDTYEQCMLLEMEIERGDTQAALARLGRIKGMLAVLCLGLVLSQLIQVGSQEVRRPQGNARVVRVIRRGREDWA